MHNNCMHVINRGTIGIFVVDSKLGHDEIITRGLVVVSELGVISKGKQGEAPSLLIQNLKPWVVSQAA